MNQTNICLDSCVVIKMIKNPTAAQKVKAKLKNRPISIILPDTVLGEVKRILELETNNIVQKVAKILGKKIKLTYTTNQQKQNAKHITTQYAQCHRGDNLIMSQCMDKDYILMTYDRKLRQACNVLGVMTSHPEVGRI